MDKEKEFLASCPIPIADYPHVTLAHGSGGKMMHQLVEKIFSAAFRNPYLDAQHDGALLDLSGRRIAFTTDSYVVHPLFFPGGDIGSMAVYGTVNDLAMCGAVPLYLSAGFILEEGLPMETLWRVVQSMQKAAAHAGVQIVTGDTKVVDHGKADGVFINTAGIGMVKEGVAICPAHVRAGDAILLSGDVGRHGMAVMAVRESLGFESAIESDCAPVAGLVARLLEGGVRIHCMRDCTRGGLATALAEISRTAKVHISIDEPSVAVSAPVHAACEILGLDPLYVANEGRFIAFVEAQDAPKALAIMRAHESGAHAAIIGRVEKQGPGLAGLVTMKSLLGTQRILDMLSGDQLPRIC